MAHIVETPLLSFYIWLTCLESFSYVEEGYSLFDLQIELPLARLVNTFLFFVIYSLLSHVILYLVPFNTLFFSPKKLPQDLVLSFPLATI
jgi:hypothetical protein